MFTLKTLKNYLHYTDIENLPCDLQEVFQKDLYDFLVYNGCILVSNDLLNILLTKFDNVYRFTFIIDYKLQSFFYHNNKRL